MRKFSSCECYTRSAGVCAVLGLLAALLAGSTGTGPRNATGAEPANAAVDKPESPAAEQPAEAESAFTPAQLEFFEKQVRPVLAEHCYSCHGAKKQEGGLRLDSRAAILRGSDSGVIVAAGQTNDSLLLDAIRYDGLEMPPTGKLDQKKIDAIEQWVKLGLPWPADSSAASADAAAWKSHWAFQPVQDPPVPAVQNGEWPRGDLDHFVLAKLEAAGISPSPEADRRTLIRRATFDLIGLPPTPEEIAAFQSDRRPEAFATVIDRLLESPHYGERWGRYWLDVARYADNKGYVFFEEKNFPYAWTYRDYVVRALNEDLPFDRFVQYQLAADQMELDGDPHPLAAMGFLTLGARFSNNQHDIIDDRIDVVTRGLMGLTVTCARCHDHKFDPTSQADYYALYGVFRSSLEPTVPPVAMPVEDTPEYRAFQAELETRTAALNTFIEQKHTALVLDAKERAAEYLLAAQEARNAPPQDEFMLLTEAGGLNPTMVGRWKGLLEGTDRNREPVLHIWHELCEVPAESFAEKSRELAARIRQQAAEGTLPAGEQSGQAAVRPNPLVVAAVLDPPPESLEQLAERYAGLLQQTEQLWQNTLKENEARAAEGTAEGQAPAIPDRLADPHREQLRKIFHGPHAPPDVPVLLGAGFLALLPDRPAQGEFKKLLKEVETWIASGKGAPPRANVLIDQAVPMEPHIFIRGNASRLGKQVPRRFPEFLSQVSAEPFRNGSGRLELARAITSPQNPLTPRVIVNRVWKHHFGHGLVRTPSDFGLRSDPPTHPLLLDSLATQFMREGWSLKQLHRTIMLSATYRQSSAVRSEIVPLDPENRLLHRMNRQRLDFEAMRDAMLFVSGAMDRRQGGPPVNIVGEGLVTRRSIYGFIDRMDLPGLLRTFDFPSPAATSPGREVTTVPPQALYLMNNGFVQAVAGRLSTRPDLTTADESRERVIRAMRLVFGRDPAPSELEAAVRFLDEEPSRTEKQQAWSYGYGQVDETAGKVSEFHPLTWSTGTRLQGGPKLPDPKIGWVFMDARGGHPAGSPRACNIRRWTAPAASTLKITAKLGHAQPQGDGVRGRIVSSTKGILGQWEVHNSEVETPIAALPVKPGDTVDFAVDIRTTVSFDSFSWPVKLELTQAESSGKDASPAPHSWDSVAEFTLGKTTRWTQFLQALLMTNEFVFID
ncbi:MAG: PSD1 domain-containing protein [Planctomycetaceae bacterium]|nr:PSD1 domain-containing protein [Planctomycetaceae bacterium]